MEEEHWPAEVPFCYSNLEVVLARLIPGLFGMAARDLVFSAISHGVIEPLPKKLPAWEITESRALQWKWGTVDREALAQIRKKEPTPESASVTLDADRAEQHLKLIEGALRGKTLPLADIADVIKQKYRNVKVGTVLRWVKQGVAMQRLVLFKPPKAGKGSKQKGRRPWLVRPASLREGEEGISLPALGASSELASWEEQAKVDPARELSPGSLRAGVESLSEHTD